MKIIKLTAENVKRLRAVEIVPDGTVQVVTGENAQGKTSVLDHGVPFSQASSAEQIRVSLAMAMAMNPKLRVLRIVDGSLLDKSSMQQIASMAAERDYQIWIERVEDDSASAVVIEDGQVA